MNRTPFAWKYTTRELRRRPLRALLTLLGVVLGVAAATSVTLGSRATHDAYPGMFDVLAGRAQLELRGADGHAFFTPPETIDVEGVEVFVPHVQAPAGLVTRGGPEPVMVLGVDDGDQLRVRDYSAAEGDYPSFQGRNVWLEAGFAARHGIRLGNEVELLTARGPTTLRVRGLLDPVGPMRFNGGGVAVVPQRVAQRLFAGEGKVNTVSVVVRRGADVEAVRGRLAEAFPNLSVVRPTERGGLADEFLGTVYQALGSMGAVAVVAGAMVILNTFLMHLGESQRQLALLRALGATRGQVTAMLLRQALLLGGLGTLIGVPLGVLLAWLLMKLFESFMNVPMPRFTISWTGLLLTASLGPAMTLAATVYPARRAARREPLADLRRRPMGDGPAPKWPPYLGGALLAVVFVFEIAVVWGWLSGPAGARLLPLMSGCGLVGCACLVPLVQAPLLRLVGWAIGPVLGVEGRLAVRGLLRHRARTGLTVGVLFAAVAAALAFGVGVINNTRDIREWYDHTVAADFLVRAVRPDPAVVLTPAPIPPRVGDEIGKLPGVASSGRLRFVPLRMDGTSLVLIARDFEEPVPLIVHEGDAKALPALLRQGEVAVGTALANRLRLKAGGTMTLPMPEGPRRVRVAAVVKEYSGAGLALYADYEQARAWFDFDGPHAVALRARPGERDKLAAELGALARRETLWVQPNEDFAHTIERVVRGVRWLLAGMLALIAAVAAAGVVNTLTTNVLDQTRELGVLRALGMKRGGVVKLVLAQALALAAVTCLTGGPAGLFIAWLMNVATPGLQGHHVEFHVPPFFVAACLLAATVLAVLAALVPARRAARLAVIDAVRHE
jgi:putative ABC transport system permease protein